jgi:hypothetical protein
MVREHSRAALVRLLLDEALWRPQRAQMRVGTGANAQGELNMSIARSASLSMLAIAALALGACEKKTPAEKMGDKVEDLGDKAEDVADKADDKLTK